MTLISIFHSQSCQGQNKDSLIIDTCLNATINTLYLEVCYKPENKGNGIYGVIRIKQNFDDCIILCYFDCAIGALPECEYGKLNKNYTPNSIMLNNDTLLLGDKLEDIDISLFIPEKIISIKTDINQFIVFEMYNCSYTTVGHWYVYIVAELDESGRINRYKTFIFDKKPMPTNRLTKDIEELFGLKINIR